MSGRKGCSNSKHGKGCGNRDCRGDACPEEEKFPWKGACPPEKPWQPPDSDCSANDCYGAKRDAVVQIQTQTGVTASTLVGATVGGAAPTLTVWIGGDDQAP